MLQAQVNYWNLVEQSRHNIETESQGRENLRLGFENLRFNYVNLDETRRHNTVTEQLGFQTLQENARHNLQTESISWFNASETQRHNRAQEVIGMNNVYVAQANANTNRLQALNAVQKTNFDNVNTRYANRTARLNAYSKEKDTLLKQRELDIREYEAGIKAAEMPSKYLNIVSNLIK